MILKLLVFLKQLIMTYMELTIVQALVAPQDMLHTTGMMELYQDTHVYNTGLVTVVEIMGRNAGWLTATSALANLKGCGPDLIYIFITRGKQI